MKLIHGAFDPRHLEIVIERTITRRKGWGRPKHGKLNQHCDHAWPDIADPDWNRIDDAIQTYMEGYGVPVSREADLRLSALRYHRGDYQPRHWDYDDLALSATVLVRNTQGGGMFRYENRFVRMNPGDMVIFPSTRLHEVTPVHFGTRISLVRFMAGPETVKSCSEAARKRRSEVIYHPVAA